MEKGRRPVLRVGDHISLCWTKQWSTKYNLLGWRHTRSNISQCLHSASLLDRHFARLGRLLLLIEKENCFITGPVFSPQHSPSLWFIDISSWHIHVMSPPLSFFNCDVPAPRPRYRVITPAPGPGTNVIFPRAVQWEDVISPPFPGGGVVDGRFEPHIKWWVELS